MNRRAGAASSVMRNQVVAGSSVATVGRRAVGGGGQRGEPLVGRDVEVVRGQGAQLRGQLGAAGGGELVGVEPDRHARRPPAASGSGGSGPR